jgi:hypothetical protein
MSIDLDKVRLSQDFTEMTRTEKLLIHVPVRKPSKHQFFRVHPDEEYRLECFVVEMDGNETYLVDPAVAGAIPGLPRPVRLLLTVTRYGAPALWPLKLPGEDGKTNPWNDSAAECAEIAMERWVRMVANRDLGAYEAIVAEGIPTEPAWPNKSMEELVSKAFRDRYVESEDHPLIRELSGIA